MFNHWLFEEKNKQIFVAFADFHGTNTSTVAYVKLKMFKN